MILRAILLSALCCAASAAAFAEECQIPDYRFNFGEESSISIIVKTGLKCGSRTYADRALIRKITISRLPKNGMATVESNRWSYQSNPGFTGIDSFAMAIVGQTLENPAMLTVNVSVTK